MPNSEYVGNHQRQRTESVQNGKRQAEEKGKRRAIPVAVEQNQGLLSPLLGSLPLSSALSNLSSMRRYLPSNQQGGNPLTLTSDEGDQVTFCKWQNINLARGSTPPQAHHLLCTENHLLRIFRYTSSKIQEESVGPEEFEAPEEIFSLKRLTFSEKAIFKDLDGSDTGRYQVKGNERVVCAEIVKAGQLARVDGPAVIMLVVSSSDKGVKAPTGKDDFSLVVLELFTGVAVWSIQLGAAYSATCQISPKAICVSLSTPASLIHLLHPSTFAPLMPPLTDISPSTSHHPPFALSGRLLAYATSSAPRHTTVDGLGTIITANSSIHTAPYSRSRQSAPSPIIESRSFAIYNTATTIGGAAARSVWAGIKLGAQAARSANQARLDRSSNGLARSAPTEGSVLMAAAAAADEPRSLDDNSSTLEETFPAEGVGGTSQGQSDSGVKEEKGDVWIKIIDIAATSTNTLDKSPYDDTSTTLPLEPKNIAHFQIPPTKAISTFDPTQSFPNMGSKVIKYLSWNEEGTLLFVAPMDGRRFHVVELKPLGSILGAQMEVVGQVIHQYEMKRGNTNADVVGVEWDKQGKWIGVVTGRGTIHVYALHPHGALPSFSTHSRSSPSNHIQLPTLSTVIPSVTKLRPPLERSAASTTADRVTEGSALTSPTFMFIAWRRNLQQKQEFHQDVVVYRPKQAFVELVRMKGSQVRRPENGIKEPRRTETSGLTDLLKAKSVGDLIVQHQVLARWMMPDVEDDLHLNERPTRTSRRLTGPKPPLAHAEIQTFSSNTRILPCSIYLSHQFEFFSINSKDQNATDKSNQSRKKLKFRSEVRPTSPTSQSFNLASSINFEEPLTSAAQSIIDSNGMKSEIPFLPNGSNGIRRSPIIPIKHVAAGVGEGIGIMKNQYTLMRHRRRRASSHNNVNGEAGLSFEEDTVFPSADDHSDDLRDHSPTSSSEIQPHTATSTDTSERNERAERMLGSDDDHDAEWDERWEEEYKKAIEDDQPDDLILGLMDEEEDERRRMIEKAKEVAGKGR